MCAVTTCPFSSSTRNVVFGSVSTTVPSICIASSFGIQQQLSRPARGALLHTGSKAGKPLGGGRGAGSGPAPRRAQRLAMLCYEPQKLGARDVRGAKTHRVGRGHL